MKLYFSCNPRFIAVGIGLGLACCHSLYASEIVGSPVTFSTDQQVAGGVAIGDVNEDGRADVVMTGLSGDPAVPSKLWVFIQDANGKLPRFPISYFTQGFQASVSIGDVTGDGRPDVVVQAGRGIEVFPQNASGALDPSHLYLTQYSEVTQIADLNGDGRIDAIGLTNSVNGTDNASDGGILLQNSSGTFDGPFVVSAPHGIWDDLQISDVNGDGLNDVVVMDGYKQPNISILYQTPSGTFAAPVSFNVLPGVITRALGVGDINGDGRKDIVVTYGGYETDSHIAILLQSVGGDFPLSSTFNTEDAQSAVEIADINNDGLSDILLHHKSTVGWLLQQPDGSLATEHTIPSTLAPYGIPVHGMAVGDVNGDSRADIVLSVPAAHLLAVHYGQPPNSPPIVNPDFAKMERDDVIAIDVLNNDSDPDGDAFSVSNVSSAGNGTTQLLFNGQVGYEPNKHFVGTDSFVYTVSNDKGDLISANVVVEVVKKNKD